MLWYALMTNEHLIECKWWLTFDKIWAADNMQNLELTWEISLSNVFNKKIELLNYIKNMEISVCTYKLSNGKI
jgi:hypothetical protein